jgi:SAM-dependent methyltransferase
MSIKVCRMCKKADLTKFLDLGCTPPADQFKREEQLLEPDIYYPLDVFLCNGCGLAQLGHIVSPEILYRNDYPYESSTTQAGQKHFFAFAKSVTERLGLKFTDLAVDIGSNVGVLLSGFKDVGVRVLGVDPAANIVRIAEKRGIETINEFFNAATAESIVQQKKKAAVITATNVFAHVDDLDAFMQAVDILLDEKGVFIFEAPHFMHLVKFLEYDTIYHEHLSYLSLTPLIPFFHRFNMEIFDVEQVDIHGGSFRVFVTRRTHHRKVSPAVGKMLKLEKQMKLHTLPVLRKFAKAVEKNRRDVTWLLQRLRHEGKEIAGVSAPAKGMTLLNYCGLGSHYLNFVTEKSKLKIGRFTPGTRIPVVSDDVLIQKRPDYALLLAWNFAEEIMNNLREYKKAGGKFIIPIPTPRIVG